MSVDVSVSVGGATVNRQRSRERSRGRSRGRSRERRQKLEHKRERGCFWSGTAGYIVFAGAALSKRILTLSCRAPPPPQPACSSC